MAMSALSGNEAVLNDNFRKADISDETNVKRGFLSRVFNKETGGALLSLASSMAVSGGISATAKYSLLGGLALGGIAGAPVTLGVGFVVGVGMGIGRFEVQRRKAGSPFMDSYKSKKFAKALGLSLATSALGSAAGWGLTNYGASAFHYVMEKASPAFEKIHELAANYFPGTHQVSLPTTHTDIVNSGTPVNSPAPVAPDSTPVQDMAAAPRIETTPVAPVAPVADASVADTSIANTVANTASQPTTLPPAPTVDVAPDSVAAVRTPAPAPVLTTAPVNLAFDGPTYSDGATVGTAGMPDAIPGSQPTLAPGFHASVINPPVDHAAATASATAPADTTAAPVVEAQAPVAAPATGSDTQAVIHTQDAVTPVETAPAAPSAPVAAPAVVNAPTPAPASDIATNAATPVVPVVTAPLPDASAVAQVAPDASPFGTLPPISTFSSPPSQPSFVLSNGAMSPAATQIQQGASLFGTLSPSMEPPSVVPHAVATFAGVPLSPIDTVPVAPAPVATPSVGDRLGDYMKGHRVSHSVRHLMNRAAHGAAQAQKDMAMKFYNGLGVHKDLSIARDLYEEAARKGNVQAIADLKDIAANHGFASLDHTAVSSAPAPVAEAPVTIPTAPAVSQVTQGPMSHIVRAPVSAPVAHPVDAVHADSAVRHAGTATRPTVHSGTGKAVHTHAKIGALPKAAGGLTCNWTMNADGSPAGAVCKMAKGATLKVGTRIAVPFVQVR